MEMQANLLNALINIMDYGDLDISAYSSKYLNRVNSVGEQLEYYIKDAIAGSFAFADKSAIYSKVYSYLGNQNNPPDAIIRGGDAFEIKKITSRSASIALNSSPPKDRLYSDDPRITSACVNCEPGWRVKEIFYAVGQISGRKISQLLFVHGRCYAADRKIYESLHESLKGEFEKVMKAKGIESGSTVELGRVNRVDPLGITELRVRGMWQMKNPLNFFENELWNGKAQGHGSFVGAIMLKSKYDEFPEKDRERLKRMEGAEIRQTKLKDPNNPANLLDGIVIKMVV
ncbi:MAG: NgoPII family restriction endonuclease [Candidatus Bathyarchaeia archaeon]